MHLETIGFTATAPSTGAAAAAVSGDSLTIKHGRNPRILSMWCDYQSAGSVQVNFPTAHDTTRGFRARVVASEVTPRTVLGLAMPVTPQETLSVTLVGSATGGDVENGCLMIAHDEVPGSRQLLTNWSNVVNRYEKLTTVDFSIDVTAGGAWNGGEAINAESDLLLANREYAILGIDFGVECCAVAIRGSHSSGVRQAVPGSVEYADMSQSWFAILSRAFGDADLIPVFNSANKANILLDALQDENIADVTGTLMLALLKP